MDPAAGQAWLEPRADEMAALLEELVAIDTENPPGCELGRCGRVLHRVMNRSSRTRCGSDPYGARRVSRDEERD